MADVAFVIIAQDIDNTQRSLIHAWIKENTDEWWHQLPDVWVVVGQDVKFWRSGLRGFALENTQILVLGLKNTRGDRWGVVKIANSNWFAEHLPPVVPKDENPTT